MPNHVTNEIIFRNVTAEQQSAILARVHDAEGHASFEGLVPTPLNVWLGNVGSRHEEAFGKSRCGLDWSRENWGTKWDAYGHKPTVQTADTLTLTFDTAWSPPYPWLVALLNAFKLPFEHNCLSEGWDRAKSATWGFDRDNKWETYQWEEKEADDAMHRHMHMLRWGVEEFPPEDDDPEHDWSSPADMGAK